MTEAHRDARGCGASPAWWFESEGADAVRRLRPLRKDSVPSEALCLPLTKMTTRSLQLTQERMSGLRCRDPYRSK
jgi:hypothetical protein